MNQLEINQASVWSDALDIDMDGGGRHYTKKVKADDVQRARLYSAQELFVIDIRTLYMERGWALLRSSEYKVLAHIYARTPSILRLISAVTPTIPLITTTLELGNRVGTYLALDLQACRCSLELSRASLEDHLHYDRLCSHDSVQACLVHLLSRGVMEAYNSYTAIFRLLRVRQRGECRISVPGFRPPTKYEQIMEETVSGWRLSVQGKDDFSLSVETKYNTSLIGGFSELKISHPDQQYHHLWCLIGSDQIIVRADSELGGTQSPERYPDKFAKALMYIRALYKYISGILPLQDHSQLDQSTHYTITYMIEEEKDHAAKYPNRRHLPY